MAAALKGKKIYPNIHVEGDEKVSYAVSCRHCEDPICVKSCIAGALSKKDGVMNKCELCLQNACGEPACVKGCPNNAIVYEQR